MVKIIEKATNPKEFVEICKKYQVMPISQPTMVFSQIVEKLYEQNSKNNYAIGNSETSIEILCYSNKEELVNYCKKNNLWMLSLVNKDGSARCGKLEYFLND